LLSQGFSACRFGSNRKQTETSYKPVVAVQEIT
jgi:hypothetical protein